MVDFTKVILTAKVNQLLKTINIPTVQFDTTSTTFVDVTGFNVTVDVNFWAGLNVSMKNATGNAEARIAIGTTGIVGALMVVASGVFVRKNSGVIKNTSGSSDTAKLELKASSATASIEASNGIIVSAPFVNISDRFFLAQVTEIKFITIDSTLEGIEGILSNQNDTDVSIVAVKSVMRSFIFSANSGNLLYDWDGSSIEAT